MSQGSTSERMVCVFVVCPPYRVLFVRVVTAARGRVGGSGVPGSPHAWSG